MVIIKDPNKKRKLGKYSYSLYIDSFFQNLQVKGCMKTSDYYSLYPNLSPVAIRNIVKKMYQKYESQIIKQPFLPRIRQNTYFFKDVYPFIEMNEMDTILTIFERQRKNLWVLGQLIHHTPEIDACMEKIMKDIQNIEYLYKKKGVLK